jgi:predicted dehydrogenase
MRPIGVGMLGSGFIGEFHTLGLRYVPDARVVANYGAGAERRQAFAARHGSRPVDSIAAVCADPDVDLVVVSLPNQLHRDAVLAAAAAGKAVACTKPLGRNADEAADMLRAVTGAGVFNAYLENVVFNPDLVRMHRMIDAGSIGRMTTFRAREGHSGPHAAHFWDADLAGGGALLDMASHGVECARYLFGKDLAAREVFAWGDTLVHGARTTGEDNAVMIVRFADGRAATCDVSWSSRGGLEGRFEVYGDAGRMIEDISVGSLKAFIERPAGYLVEKADAETGWVFPVPDEVRVHGHDLMMADVVTALRDGRAPQETFRDGYVVNGILDAAYRSMRSGHWEPVVLDDALLAAEPMAAAPDAPAPDAPAPDAPAPDAPAPDAPDAPA